MTKARQLTISNPSIGGSGYLTLAAMQADAAIHGGYHAVIHQCRGLAQAGGPLCLDVVIREHEIEGAVSHFVDYVNGFDMSEAWRGISSAKDFRESFPRGLTVIADFYVELPILVTASRKGPGYLSREEFLQKFKDLIKKGYDLRVVAYNFSKHTLSTILKGAFSFGVITADLAIRQDDRFITLSKEAAIEGINQNVPPAKEKQASEKRLKLNRDVFERGYAAREQYPDSRDQRIILI